MDDKSRLEFIQALRGLAALGVVICHARYILLTTPWWPGANQYLVWGAGGVDLFFVISGFIMVYTTRKNDGSFSYLKLFAIKRFAKIWPAYAVASTVFLFLGRGGFSYLSHHCVFVLNSLLFIPQSASGPTDFGSANTTLPVGWSLNFEFYFYIIFGASMLFGRWRWAVLTVWMVVFLVAIPVLYGSLSLDPMVGTHIHASYLAMMASPLIWDFVAGMLIAGLYFCPVAFPSQRSAWIVILVMATVCAFGYAGNIGSGPGISGWGGYAALIMLTLAMASKTISFQIPRIAVALGDMSFTLYLVQYMILVTPFRSLVLKAVGRPDLSHSWAMAILCTCASLVLASIASPLEGWLHRIALENLSKRRNIPMVLAPESSVN